MVRLITTLVFTCGLVFVAMNVAAAEKTYNMISIDYPNAIATSIPGGINDRGEIVGAYTDSGGKVHGFLFSNGNFTTIDVPGAATTLARGINSRGDIVGSYQVVPSKPGGDFHGFLWRDGELTFIDYDPSHHPNTILQRISATGVIVGCYHDADTMGSMHGIKLSSDGSQEVTVPASMNNATSPEGNRTVGLYTDMNNQGYGYVIDKDVFTPFRVPESKFTAAWDMNPSGEIVGVFIDQSNKTHGFLRKGEDYLSIDFPGARLTRSIGINARGDVVGTYVDSMGRTRGFLAEVVHKNQ